MNMQKIEMMRLTTEKNVEKELTSDSFTYIPMTLLEKKTKINHKTGEKSYINRLLKT